MHRHRAIAACLLALLVAGCFEPDETAGVEDEPGEVLVELEHDFTQPPEERTFVIPETGPYDVEVKFLSVADACPEGDAVVRLVDPQGLVWLSLHNDEDRDLEATEACPSLFREGDEMMAGEWTAVFEGEADVTGIVRVGLPA